MTPTIPIAITLPLRAPILGVTTIIHDQGGRILIGRKSRACMPELVGKWVTPGGRVNFGETVEAAAVREAKEETGLTILLSGWRAIEELITNDKHFVFVVFTAYSVGDPSLAFGQDDLSEVRWITAQEIGLKLSANQFTPLTARILGCHSQPSTPQPSTV